jgi:tRNA-(ms[2]io[6]A)-hydroxylase
VPYSHRDRPTCKGLAQFSIGAVLHSKHWRPTQQTILCSTLTSRSIAAPLTIRPAPMSESPLRYRTPPAWTEMVLENMDEFLLDHAAAEKKASGMAISMLSHYPDRTELVAAMADLAVEELTHYREVVKWIHQRGQVTASDTKDPYVTLFRASLRQGSDVYLMDRLLIGSIIEARGAERFGLIAEALEAGPLKQFYVSIARSEERHYEVFLNLANHYLDAGAVQSRWDELLDIEAAIVATLPIRAALH